MTGGLPIETFGKKIANTDNPPYWNYDCAEANKDCVIKK